MANENVGAHRDASRAVHEPPLQSEHPTGKLSEHFQSSEFACPCCGEAKVKPELVQALEELRRLAGAPIVVISGYRCPKHNGTLKRAVQNSQHALGTAADILIPGKTMGQIFLLAEQIGAFHNGGIGTYPEDGTVHVDVREHIARWTFRQGRYGPLTEAA